jgi:hypothetical protein
VTEWRRPHNNFWALSIGSEPRRPPISLGSAQ